MGTFNLNVIGKAFSTAITDDDVLLRNYCDGYVEISGLLSFFGKIFYFVTKDVNHKINILYEHNKRDPVRYKSIKSMTAHEASLGITGHAQSKHSNGARTLLRLNRALLFVIDMLEAICTGPEDVPLRRLVKDIYSADLAPYHPWPIRRAVDLAVYSIPHRDEVIDHIVNSQPADGHLATREACRVAVMERVLPAMRSVYACAYKWMEQHNQLELP